MVPSIAAIPPNPSGPDVQSVPGSAGKPPASGEIWSTSDDISFEDIIDIVNPLHHIPIVSTIYRAVSNDQIGLGARLIGGGLYGGPLGFLASGLAAFVDEVTEGNIGSFLAGRPSQPAARAVASHETERNHSAEPARVRVSDPARGTATQVSSPEAVMAGMVPGGRKTMDAQSLRITRSLMDAQRAQAQLLFASLSIGDARETVERPPATAKDSLRPHPNMPPRNVKPEWFKQAMERALTQYNKNQSGHQGSERSVVRSLVR